MRLVSLFAVLALLLATTRVEAQNAPPTRRDPGGFARGAAIGGTVGAGLLLGGSVAIALVDDLESERITRGVWLGTLTLTAPIIALGAWTARRRAEVEGYKQLRWLGWTSWTFAVANGGLQWYQAFHDRSLSPGLTVGLGALGALSLLPLSLDAFVSARRATMRARFRIAFVPILQL